MVDQNNRYQEILAKLTGRPWFIWFISAVEIIVFIAELGVSGSLTGSPIQMKPSFNPLIGPSAYVLIHMGARFAPCMYTIRNITDDPFFHFPCPNYTGLAKQDSCTLSELCGFGGVGTPPNQWYRFIIPIFLHGGLLHIAVNIFTQLVFGMSMEKKIGSFRFGLLYFVSGIFGLLPIIDNFAHIGGFIMGLLLGSVLLKPPARFRRQQESNRTFSTISEGKRQRFLHNRSGKWWLWWLLRFVIMGITITLFVLSLLNIYRWRSHCTWCKYLNCLPVNGWCDTDYITTTDMMNSTLTSPIGTTNLYTSTR